MMQYPARGDCAVAHILLHLMWHSAAAQLGQIDGESNKWIHNGALLHARSDANPCLKSQLKE